MKKKIKRLLIIPAKSNSSRIKNKNFKKFLGKPIIEYSYQVAKKSKIFDKIHISTESNRVKNFLKKNNIHVDFLRKKNLARYDVGLFDVYKFVFNEYKKRGLKFDEVWTLLPCSPLIEVSDILKLKNKIFQKELQTPVITVCKYPAPIEWAFTMNKRKMLFPKNKKKQNIPSQKFTNTYYDVGVLSVFSSINFNSNKKNFSFYGYELAPQKSVDIDEMQDWVFAEKLFKIKLNK